MTSVRTGADRFLQLADQYARSGNTRMEAECRYQRAQSLGRGQKTVEGLVQSGDTSALIDLRKERAAEYERAAELFATNGLVGEAGRCWYQAAYEYNWLGLVRPEYREKCYSTCSTAAEHLGAAGDWWGKGLAEFAAGQTLRTGVIGGPPDPRNIPALRRAAEAFTRANRPVEAAAVELTAAVALTQTGGEAWMPTAVEALHTYEQARPSLRIPKDREINDRIIVANGARVLTSKVSRSAATMREHPVWSELVWLLSEAPKARSFQDQHLQDDTWSRLAADDSTLSELMTRRKDLAQEHTDLERMIKAAVVTRRSDAKVQVMEQELRLKERGLEDIDRQVATRFQRLAHDTPERIELLSTSPVTPQQLQACLEPGEAYIGYRWNDGAPLRSIVTRATVTTGLATGVTSEFATQAVAAGRDGEDLPRDEFTDADRLIGSVPEETDTLIISPDSLLLGLPWHQLPSPGQTDSNLTLGERYTISIVPAAGVLRHLRTNRPSAARPGQDTAYLGVACDGGGEDALSFVDQEVKATRRNHFADEAGSGCLVTADCGRFLERGCSAGLLHLACHAEPHGLLLSCDGTWTRPTDLLNVPGRTFGADILLLTGCSAGDFSGEENNEFLGVVRQLIVVTGARAAVASVAPVPDAAGVLFADLFVSALNGKSPDRPWRTPGHPLAVGPALAWARQTMRTRLRVEDVKAVVAGCEHPRPARSTWWSPWFVVGDPRATTSGGRTT
ncbi:CHAT domain-containing protein [Streptomyces sp. NBC_01142]|uniref:CHAT domain-containing protein n=1 Tax=Streptomyces sp. NBC_01142 TaxID=2975865 RepID=UPI002253069E|nr:CHAT domain-containing protein [Streptomyces sp. NBC_01142]MCX4826838.1 CHAT domain-containing protein [Streptomyces sp. NBC_01142]